MTIQELKILLSKLRENGVSGASVKRLISYARIYAAPRNMILADISDAEYSDYNEYLKNTYAVFDELSCAYGKEQTIAGRGEILWTMFYVVYGIVEADGGRREEYCHKLAEDLIKEYFERGMGEDTDELFEIMRIIFVSLYGVMDDEPDPWREFVQHAIAGWVEEINEGKWDGISDIEAAQRLILLNMNSSQLLDEQYDHIIEQLYPSYCSISVLPANDVVLDEMEIRRLCLLYDLSQSSIVPIDRELPKQIGDILLKQYHLLPAKEDLSALCLSIAIEEGDL